MDIYIYINNDFKNQYNKTDLILERQCKCLAYHCFFLCAGIKDSYMVRVKHFKSSILVPAE